MGNENHSVNEEQNLAVPSDELRPTSELKGEVCKRCGELVADTCPTWWRTNDALWQFIYGTDAGIRCIPCFTKDALAKNVTVRWVATPYPADNLYEPKYWPYSNELPDEATVQVTAGILRELRDRCMGAECNEGYAIAEAQIQTEIATGLRNKLRLAAKARTDPWETSTADFQAGWSHGQSSLICKIRDIIDDV